MPRTPARSNFHVMLLAGGSGTRFWPLSRARRPKQLLALAGPLPMLVATWRRMRKLAPPRRMWVVAPRQLAPQIRRLLPELRPDRLVLEPSPRDTAPAVGLACARVAQVDPAAIVGVFPTDHVVRRESAFRRSVERAQRAAARGRLVCLGIRPDRPATGFGYLECLTPPRGVRAVAVKRFVEKPDLARAKRYLKTGRYLWNAGMFVWRVERFLDELARTAPEIHRSVTAFVNGDRRAWNRATRLSVDYAVMEHATGVEVAPLDAGWDDVGSWDAAGRLREEQGIVDDRAIIVDSPNSAVFADKRVIALVGVPDVAVVDTPDALLIVSRGQSEKVRRAVEELRRRGAKELL